VGDPDLNVSCGNVQYSEHRLGSDELLLCPPLVSKTIFISVFAFDSYASYDLTVYEYPVSMVPRIDHFEKDFPFYAIGDGDNGKVRTNSITSFFQNYQFTFWPSLNLSCGLHVESKGNTFLTLSMDDTVYKAYSHIY